MKDKIIHFLENHLIGKKLATDEVVYTLGDGNLEGIYSDQMVFSNLERTVNGFKFNLTTITPILRLFFENLLTAPRSQVFNLLKI